MNLRMTKALKELKIRRIKDLQERLKSTNIHIKNEI